jgi:ribosomal protein L11 methyltransferase
VPAWPDPPARWLVGWYLRSPAHAPAPAGVRELVQVPGEGFGPAGHPTTAMCLAALDALAPGPAVDAGCGSGLLAQAWARLEKGPVAAFDLDPRAIDQAGRSLAAAGLSGRVRLHRRALGGLAAGALGGRVVFANVPASAHHELLARIGAPPRAVVLSGLRPGEAPAVEEAWRARGLATRRRNRRAGYVCLVMTSTGAVSSPGAE